nr:reverse transcriptase zinc-binding domain-containing protein [Tanacetum cinerariifolium]
MACSVSHTYDEIKATVEKQIENDKARQLAIINLAVEYDNFCGAKDDLRKAYELCNHIPQETRALIDTFLKEGYNKDYKLHNSLFGKAAKIEKQINAKLVWLREKYNYRLQTHIVRIILGPAGIVQLSSSTRVEPSPSTLNPVRIILGPAGIVQLSSSTRVEPSPSTLNPVRIIPGHAGAAMILANISVFTPKPSKHHLNITMRNVVKVFHKDTIPGSGSGNG